MKTIKLNKKNLKKLSNSRELPANATPQIGGGGYTTNSNHCDQGDLPTHLSNCHPQTHTITC
ncbi:hypothetical protein [Pseudoalteromonas phenolica]|uniref:Uncharacterized protein n=1 Tax=Pseudoalteromonas phenolica TaxID=161398 RepID=A0A0S2K0Q5_9GAMM|nr:hypothetical protein [Pseudoalteromonas phenolica]ALO41785.1 hypothetical protein PP2015_1271 [Pseudoalteromonas phenolica]MBE0353658.1 hypothetical protein [Pseudoalteromonas phenolica O-BC30]